MAFLKRIGKAIFSEKNWKNALALKSKKVQVMFGKRLFWHYCLQLSFVYKSVPQIFINLFCSGNQRLSLDFLGNEVDFRYIINVSQISWRKTSKNFKKLRHGFVDERALITTTLIPFCHCWFFGIGILKIGCRVCENKPCIIAPIILKHANMFCWTYFNCLF